MAMRQYPAPTGKATDGKEKKRDSQIFFGRQIMSRDSDSTDNLLRFLLKKSYRAVLIDKTQNDFAQLSTADARRDFTAPLFADLMSGHAH
jgi:hypothetical protein